jgi:hypothetical protein
LSEPAWKIRDLNESGTRYEHYRELLDLWEDGLVALGSMNPKLMGRSEEMKKLMLDAGVALVKSELTRLSNFDKKKFDLMKVVDDIELQRQYDKAYDIQNSSPANPEAQAT